MRLIFDALSRHAAERPENVAFRAGELALSWQELHRRVQALARALPAGTQPVAVAATGIDYLVADLAVTLAGRRLVPLPQFFSADQVAHVLKDAGCGLVLDGNLIAFHIAETGGEPPPLAYPGGAERVIYTSGTTGRPKGVVLGDRQLSASIAGLASAIRAEPSDRYLSVLPAAQLLEQICGMFVPILAGAEVIFLPEGVAVLFGGPSAPMTQAFETLRPTISVLAPKQLAGWVADLKATNWRAPDSLRYIAVGGAPSSVALLTEAEALGLPVHQGYGLSEACSVVTLNRIGENRHGTAGRTLPGVKLRIDAGEIVVSGPTVMQGYLHGPAAGAEWRTGDRGRIEGGRLIVEGRKDALIVTPAGRNISPEWVEAVALADPAVIAAVLVPDGQDLVLVLAPSRPVDPAALRARLSALPGYARPAALLIADPRSPGLIRPSGAPDRGVAAALASAGRNRWQPLFQSEKAVR